MALHHPQFDPVIFSIGPVSATWYGLMYVIGFLLGYWLGLYQAKTRPGLGWNAEQVGDLLTWLMIGTIVGGRLGYVLFYIIGADGLAPIIADPLLPFKITDGGMSFHGGLIGVTLACIGYAYCYHRHTLDIGDFIAPLVPFGLFFGRMGNFINGELWGRPTDLPWGMIFTTAPDRLPRHPSQLYEAFWEGIVLLILLNWYARKPRPRGRVTGLFLVGYALGRFLVEFVREKDAQMSYYLFHMTMGQMLTIPMAAIGIWLLVRPVKAASLPFVNKASV
ncbi:prolipoprotein diacylglyceryl transferase [Suttonella ornithocola]|uniref:Phosphatidylglycerol--prolipoprotein diacylglyceryl transferase n=1 Tax=Suttonella ornithocola TaxID=279832 RepID=A0A380MSW4_9GAMM|nr:prolipoprotein diacylglyceryl transferase [Suttonella ornithocola]SUO95392.1 Prolipoprotein diacylglyceryl transferase [Suttonella ornithocola]